MPDPSSKTTGLMPWQAGLLSCWAIVGMNHYYLNGSGRRLFVAMVRFGKCIKAEGDDGPEIWADLERQAQKAATDV